VVASTTVGRRKRSCLVRWSKRPRCGEWDRNVDSPAWVPANSAWIGVRRQAWQAKVARDGKLHNVAPWPVVTRAHSGAGDSSRC
jgi:hypothetical protein